MHKIKRFLPATLFVLAELWLYNIILTSEGKTLVWSSFGSIVLCFIFALLHIRTGHIFAIAAIACTVAADFFLVVCAPIEQLYGMVCFLSAQILYALWLHRTCRQKWTIYLRLILSATGIATPLIVLGPQADALAIVSVCYYANLIMNILVSILQFRRRHLAAIGFILFLLCDTVIGLQVASKGYLPIPENSVIHQIIFSGFNLPWAFYLPSQVLLSISSTIREKED